MYSQLNGISLSAIQLLVSTTSLLIDRVQVAMSSQTKSVEEKPIAPVEAKKAPAIKKAKKAVKTAPTGEKTPSYQEMVKQVLFLISRWPSLIRCFS